MDLEQSLKFNKMQQDLFTMNEQKELHKASERKREAVEFLKTRKMFKDLLPDENSIDNFRRCKDYLFLNVLIPQIGISVNADYANGYKNALETILSVVNEYNERVREV